MVVDVGVTATNFDYGEAGATLHTATVQITGNYQSGEDVLSFSNNPATMGNITATWNATTGTLSFSSAGDAATLTQWTAALRSIQYYDGAEMPNTAGRHDQLFGDRLDRRAAQQQCGDRRRLCA